MTEQHDLQADPVRADRTAMAVVIAIVAATVFAILMFLLAA